MNRGTDKYTENFLVNTEDLYRQIVETTNEGVWVINLDGKTSYTNRRMAEMLGCTVKELLGKNAFDFVFPEDLPKWHRGFERFKLESGGIQVQFRYRKKDGTELWTLANTSVIAGPDGNADAILGMFTDITDLKRTQDKLEDLTRSLAHRVDRRTKSLKKVITDLRRMQKDLVASEIKYRGLAENTKDILIAMDVEWSINYISPQIHTYGVNPEEVTGRHLLDFVLQEDRQRVASEMERTWASGEIGTFEFRTCLSEGNTPWFEFSGAVQQDEDSNAVGITGVLRDVSERRATERALRESKEQRTKLAADLVSAQDEEQQRISEILHDQVSQLLATAKMKHGLLSNKTEVPEDAKLHQEIEGLLAKAIETLRSLSFELKTSTLIRMGLSEAIRELCTVMESRYGVRFDLDAKDTDLPIGAEVSAVLFKGARELLFNVVKQPSVAQAAVSIKRGSTYIYLTVADQGRGFPATFNRENPQLGKGLGLFGIQELMRDIGGEMEIDSIPSSHTEVTLRVPLDHDQQAADS